MSILVKNKESKFTRREISFLIGKKFGIDNIFKAKRNRNVFIITFFSEEERLAFAELIKTRSFVVSRGQNKVNIDFIVNDKKAPFLTTLFVKGIPRRWDEHDLKESMNALGIETWCTEIWKEKSSNFQRSLGVGLVVITNKETARALIQASEEESKELGLLRFEKFKARNATATKESQSSPANLKKMEGKKFANCTTATSENYRNNINKKVDQKKMKEGRKEDEEKKIENPRRWEKKDPNGEIIQKFRNLPISEAEKCLDTLKKIMEERGTKKKSPVSTTWELEEKTTSNKNKTVTLVEDLEEEILGVTKENSEADINVEGEDNSNNINNNKGNRSFNTSSTSHSEATPKKRLRASPEDTSPLKKPEDREIIAIGERDGNIPTVLVNETGWKFLEKLQYRPANAVYFGSTIAKEIDFRTELKVSVSSKQLLVEGKNNYKIATIPTDHVERIAFGIDTCSISSRNEIGRKKEMKEPKTDTKTLEFAAGNNTTQIREILATLAAIVALERGLDLVIMFKEKRISIAELAPKWKNTPIGFILKNHQSYEAKADRNSDTEMREELSGGPENLNQK